MKALLAATGPGVARAAYGAGEWTVAHLMGGCDIRGLAADPLAPGVIYAGSQRQGVLRSADGGLTWRPAGLSGYVVKSLAVSAAQPGTLYAGTKPPFVFVSHDGGQNWEELAGFRRIFSRRFWFSPAEKPFTAYVQGIALSPVDPHAILVGIEAGAVVRSADGGRTWSDHRPGALRDCHTLSFHHTDGRWAYEGGGTGAGVAVSRDGGATWRQPKDGLDRHYGWAVAADPAQPEIWYVALSPGPMKAHSDGRAEAHIYRSTGGAAWQKLTGGLPQPLDHMPYALLTDPASAGHVIAGLSNGDVWHSADYGDSWQKLPLNMGSIQRTMIAL